MSALSKFFHMDMAWHTENTSGALVGKVSMGVDKTLDIVNDISWEFFPTFVQTVLSIIPILFLSPAIGVICFAAMMVFIKFSLEASKERKKYRQPRHDLFEEEWHLGVENIQSVEMAILFGQSKRLMNEHAILHDKIVELGQTEAHLGIFKYNRLRIWTINISRTMILAFLITGFTGGGINIASLIFINVLVERLFHSYWRFARLFDRLAEASESIDRLVKLMDEKSKIEEAGEYVSSKKETDIILKNVSFSYSKPDKNGNGAAIHNLDLTIPANSVVALVGPSGAGKTTIRRIITRLYDIQAGQILIEGVDLREWDLDSLRSLFSYVPQGDDVHILAKSVRENIAYAKPNASDEEIVDAACKAGIHDFITELPEGYKTLLGERGKKLSGGQKQRMALARAILADSKIVILDEPTSAVDSITESVIQENMTEILKDKTAIIIAHRLSTVWGLADKIVVLEDGKKVEEGSHEELVKQDGLYAQMVALQTH